MEPASAAIGELVDTEDQLSDLLDDPEFQAIGQRFGRFNLFEAIGGVRRELADSNFLTFLLSPNRPHGLGTEPLRRLLRCFVEALPKEKRPLRALDIVTGDLDDAVISRERDNIDLLIELRELRLVVCIENKVGRAHRLDSCNDTPTSSGEHFLINGTSSCF
jgi:hypothetical protein